MPDFGIIPTTNKTYTISQNYTNTVVEKHEYKHSNVLLLLLLLFDNFVPTSTHPLLIFELVVCSIILK
jgi:hypothetical protein